MNAALVRLREILNKTPLGPLQPVFYAIFVLSIFAVRRSLAVGLPYGWLLCPMVWIEREKQGKDALVIQAESEHSCEWLARLSPLISNRAVILNWSERKRWDRWSLPVRLYEVFGPHGMPEQFSEFSLPSVILFQQLQPPKKFTFGERSKDLEVRLENLRAALDLN